MFLKITPYYKTNNHFNNKMTTFGWNKSNYETQSFRQEVESQKPCDEKIINERVLKGTFDDLTKISVYDNFAQIYEKLPPYNASLFFLHESLKRKENKNISLNDFLDSYVDIQRIYEKRGDIEQVSIIEEKMQELVKSNELFLSSNISEEQLLKQEKAFVNIAFDVGKELLNVGKKSEAFEIYDYIEKRFIKYSQENNTVWDEIFEFGGDASRENGLFEQSNKLYNKAIQARKTNNKFSVENQINLSHKIAENFINIGCQNEADDILNETLNLTKQPELIVQNFNLRACNEILKNNINLAAGYIKLASEIEKNNNLVKNPDLAILEAAFWRNTEDLESSSNICISTLEQLEMKDKIYSSDFIKFMMILASNNYNKYNQDKVNNKENLLQSIDTYKNALNIAEIINDDYYMAVINNHLGEVLFIERDLEKAKEHLLKANSLCDKGSLDSHITTKVKSLLGKIYIRQNNPNEAIKFFEEERKILLKDDFERVVIEENLKNIIEVYRLQNNFEKAQEYSEKLKNKELVNYKDLFYLAENNFSQGRFDKAQKLYQNAYNSDNSSLLEKAIALTHLGITKIKTETMKSGLHDMEKGCQLMEKIVQENSYTDPKKTSILYTTLNDLGEIYYFQKNDFKNAALMFEKAQKLTENKKVILTLTQEQKNRLYARVAAGFYKAQDYTKSTDYYIKYINALTGNKFSYTDLNSSYVDNIIDTINKTNDCLKIATAFEMLGVSNVKNKKFTAAESCFNTALQIRQITQGEKKETANDYKALSRLAMAWDTPTKFKQSKIYLEKAIKIMKNQLGSKDEAVQKEERFLSDYFGVNLASGGKYITRLFGHAKEFFGGKDNYTEEIIKDFHLVYEDLALCE